MTHDIIGRLLSVDEDAFKDASCVLARKGDSIIDDKKKVVISLDEKEVSQLIESMNDIVYLQKELAVKLKLIIDGRIKEELSRGHISESTLRWIREYKDVLRNLSPTRVEVEHRGMSLTDLHKVMRGDAEIIDAVFNEVELKGKDSISSIGDESSSKNISYNSSSCNLCKFSSSVLDGGVIGGGR